MLDAVLFAVVVVVIVVFVVMPWYKRVHTENTNKDRIQ